MYYIHFRHPFETMVGPFTNNATAQQYLEEYVRNERALIGARFINANHQMKPEEFAQEVDHYDPNEDPNERYTRRKLHYQC